MDQLDHLGWVVSKSYRVGSFVFGIRTNSGQAAEWLDETFGGFEIPEEVDPYYSLYVGRNDGVGRGFHILYRESTDIARSLDPAVVARRLVHELEALALRDSDGAVYLPCGVIERNGVRALVPNEIVPYLRLAGKQVERELELPREPALAVELGSGRLRPVARQLDIAEDAPGALARVLGQETSGAVAVPPPESVDLVLDFHYDPKVGPVVPATRALAVYGLARVAINLRAVGSTGLDALASLVTGPRGFVLQNATAGSTYDLVRSVMDDDSAPFEQAAV
jgi:hypothetical protein